MVDEIQIFIDLFYSCSSMVPNPLYPSPNSLVLDFCRVIYGKVYASDIETSGDWPGVHDTIVPWTINLLEVNILTMGEEYSILG